MSGKKNLDTDFGKKVAIVSPKAFTLRLSRDITIEVPQGVSKLPEQFIDHWFVLANGVITADSAGNEEPVEDDRTKVEAILADTKSQKNIIAMLKDLSEEELLEMDEKEKAGGARKGLLDAITAELGTREE